MCQFPEEDNGEETDLPTVQDSKEKGRIREGTTNNEKEQRSCGYLSGGE